MSVFRFLWDNRLNSIKHCQSIIDRCARDKVENVDNLLNLCKRICNGTRNKSTYEKTKLFDLVYWEEYKILQLMDDLLQNEVSIQYVQSVIKSHDDYQEITHGCIYENLTSDNKPYNKIIFVKDSATIKACSSHPGLFRDMLRYKLTEISKEGYVNLEIHNMTQSGSTYNVCVTWDKINCKCNKTKRKLDTMENVNDSVNPNPNPNPNHNLTTLSNKKRKL